MTEQTTSITHALYVYCIDQLLFGRGGHTNTKWHTFASPMHIVFFRCVTRHWVIRLEFPTPQSRVISLLMHQ